MPPASARPAPPSRRRKRAYDLIQARYRGGLAPYFEVLSAEDALNANRRSVADLEASAFALDVALVRALGGGFRRLPPRRNQVMNKPITQRTVRRRRVESRPPRRPTAARKKLFAGFAAALLLAGASYKGYEAMSAGHVTTDNAYVGADVAQVTPLVGGPVREVLVQDTHQVRRGQMLVRLDDTDARIALARAEAELAAAERRVRSLVANDGERSAQVSARAADAARAGAQIAAARADLDRAAIDLRRRQDLAQSGAISDEELTTARNAHSTASANLQAAQAALAQASAQREAAVGSRSTNQALIGDGRIDTNPDVLAARAAVAQARLDLERTVIRAPIDGDRLAPPGPGRPAGPGRRHADGRSSRSSRPMSTPISRRSSSPRFGRARA